MSLRVPGHLEKEPISMYTKDTSKTGVVIKILYCTNNKVYDVIDFIQSLFLDVTGAPFYDKNGIPFQGKIQ